MEHQPPGFLAEQELLVPYGLVQPLLICAVISGVLKQGRAVPLAPFPLVQLSIHVHNLLSLSYSQSSGFDASL